MKKDNTCFPVWHKGVTCPFCGKKRFVGFDQKKCKCPSCKKFYEVKR